MSAAPKLVTAPDQQRSAGGIGASESAAAIGASDYATPLDAWLVSTGRVPGFKGNEATEWGHILEPIIRARYVERHQVAVFVPPESLWHSELPWLKATPDGIVLASDGHWSHVGPQVKNVGLRMAPAWEDGIPTDYLIQGVVEMAVCDLPRIDFAVLIGGQRYEERVIERDGELEADVLEALAGFWSLVESDTQPAIDESKRFKSHLLGKIKGKATVVASTEDAATIARWREVVVQQAQLKREERVIKNRVLSAIAGAGAVRMTSELGAISVGAPRRKTAWKEVANGSQGARLTLINVADALRLAEGIEGDYEMRERIKQLAGELEIAASVTPSLPELIAAHTKTSEPSVNRPRSWTKDIDDSDDGADE